MFDVDDILHTKKGGFEMKNEHMGLIIIVIVGALFVWKWFGSKRLTSWKRLNDVEMFPHHYGY